MAPSSGAQYSIPGWWLDFEEKTDLSENRRLDSFYFFCKLQKEFPFIFLKLFIYFWLRWVFSGLCILIAAYGFFSGCSERGATLGGHRRPTVEALAVAEHVLRAQGLQ